MMKRMKKAVCLLMAACMLAGSGYTGEASTSVSITPVVQEVTEVKTTDENVNTGNVGSALEKVNSSFKGLFGNFNRIRVASAEEKEEEVKYEYVLKFTGLNAIIRNGERSAATMSPNTGDTLSVTKLKVGTDNEYGALGDKVKIKFEVADSSKDILEIVDTEPNDFSFNIVAKKPGWANLHGRIWEVDDAGKEIADSAVDFYATFLVKAELVRKDTEVWKNPDIDASEDKRILVLDPTKLENGQYQLIFEGINSEDISKSNEISESIKFTTLPAASVATMDPDGDGLIKIVGAGITTFAIQNYVAIELEGENGSQNSGAQKIGDPYEVTLIVLPTGAEEGKSLLDYKKTFTMEVDGVQREKGSKFTIQTNALDASRLQWEIYSVDQDNKKTLIDTTNEADKSKLKSHSLFQYFFDENKIKFTDVKAGTYEIKAYVTKKYSEVECLTINVVVWLNLESGEYYVNVGDYYDIAENSNIPDGMFSKVFSTMPLGTEASAVLNPITGLITALAKGEDSFSLKYNPASAGLYTKEYAEQLKEIIYTIQVIDTLSISPSSAIMYTGGELTLKANTTQHGTIYWDYGAEADKEFIEVLDNGVIKAKKKTPDRYEATVVAYQIIGGVTKRAECKIQVYETATTIELEPAAVEISVDETKTIEAILTPDNLNRFNLRWQSMNEDIFTLGTQTDTNIQIIGKNPGTATLIVINEDNGQMGYCKVTVKASVGGVKLSDEKITGLEGETWQLEATVTPEEATNKELFWWSVDPSVATVNQYGKVTFKKEGTTVICVRSKDNPEFQANCTVVVSKMLSGINILEATELEMYVGETHTIPYKIAPDNASDKRVTWQSFNTKVVTVDGNGKLTAKAPGSAMIMVMSVADPSIYVIISVTVKQKATSVSMNYKEIIMNVGEYFDMEVTIAPANSTEASLIWESLDTTVATVASNGRITARAEGSAIVLVRTESGVTSYCTVTVLEPVTSLELDPTDLVIDVGEIFIIDPVFKPAEPSNMEVTWKSYDSSIATVNKLGEVEGISRGSTVITCESVDGGFRAFCLVTVVNPEITITVTPDNYRLGHGKSYTLEATVLNKGTKIDDVELIWTSSDESICSVDENGKIYGEDFGDATITVMLDDEEVDAYATCQVRVVREVTSIKLNHTVMTIIKGQTASIEADVQPSNASYTDVIFSSEDEKIAVIDEDGVITAVGVGSTWIWAKAKDNSGKEARCYVTVIEPVPATGVTVSDKEVVLVAGETKKVVYTIKPFNTTDEVIWTAGEESIATVDGSGVITARRTGTTNVTVMTSSGKTAQVKVIVIGLSRTTMELPIYTKYSKLTVDGATSGVRWDVEDHTICEINNGTITARKAGTTYVTATVNGRTLRCKVTVTPNKKKK